MRSSLIRWGNFGSRRVVEISLATCVTRAKVSNSENEGSVWDLDRGGRLAERGGGGGGFSGTTGVVGVASCSSESVRVRRSTRSFTSITLGSSVDLRR